MKKLLIFLFIVFILSFSFIGYNQMTKKSFDKIEDHSHLALQMSSN